MRKLTLALMLLALGAGLAAAQVTRGSNASVDTTGPNGGFGAFDSRDHSTGLAVLRNKIGVTYAVVDLCDYASTQGLLVGNYFCLRPDGGFTSGMVDGGTAMNLVAVGAPVTDIRSKCSNGPECDAVTTQSVDGGSGTPNFWYTDGGEPLAGSFSDCFCGVVLDYAGTPELIAKDTGSGAGCSYGIRVGNTGGVSFDHWGVDAGYAAVTSSAGVVTTGSRTSACATFKMGTVGGADSEQRLYVAGATVGSPLTNRPGPTQGTSAQITIGSLVAAGSLLLPGRVANALHSDTLLSAAQVLAYDAACRGGRWSGTYGEAISYTRNSTAYCDPLDGGYGTWLAPGVPCIVGGAYLSEPAATNRLLNNTALNTWTKRGYGDATADQFIAPDGTLTGDRVLTGYIAANDIYSISAGGANGAANTPSIWLTGVDAGGTLHLRNPGAAGQMTIPLSLLPYDGGWLRVYPGLAGTTTDTPFVNSAAGAAGILFASPDAGPIVFGAWGGQVEDGAVASSLVLNAGTALTRAATVATVANPLSGLNPTDWCFGGTISARSAASGRMVASVGDSVSDGSDTAVLYEVADGTARFIVYDAAGGNKYVSTNAAISAASHVLVACANSGTVSLWVDGVSPAQTTSGAGTGVITTQPSTIYIGTRSAGYLAHYVYNVRVWAGGYQ